MIDIVLSLADFEGENTETYTRLKNLFQEHATIRVFWNDKLSVIYSDGKDEVIDPKAESALRNSCAAQSFDCAARGIKIPSLMSCEQIYYDKFSPL